MRSCSAGRSPRALWAGPGVRTPRPAGSSFTGAGLYVEAQPGRNPTGPSSVPRSAQLVPSSGSVQLVLIIPLPPSLGFPGGSDGKESACNAGDPGSILSSRRSGEGKGNPLQYSYLENPMDGGAWWATVHGVPQSRTPLSNNIGGHVSARGALRALRGPGSNLPRPHLPAGM